MRIPTFAATCLLPLAAAACGPPAGAGRAAGVPDAGGQRSTDLLPAPLGDLGDFPAVERSGLATRTSDLRGRIVVADFIFTSCAGPCPPMTERMATLQQATRGMPDVLLATFTVDPARDTPEVLSKYASNAGADPGRWRFLRCERTALVDILCDRLKLVADRDDLLLHSTRFVLFDREGRGRAFYMPLEDERWLAKILNDIEALRGEPARQAEGTGRKEDL